MLENVKQFHHPRTLAEASALLAATGVKNVALAGGTHLAAVDNPSIEGLVDLKGLRLDYLKKRPGGYALGAMTPVQAVAKATNLKGPAGALLRCAAQAIGSTPLRNAITVGGNCVAVFPWSDLPPAMGALDAEFVIARGTQERVVPFATLYQVRPTAELAPGELVTEIRVPEFGPGVGTAFHKVGKVKNDFSLITVAVRLEISRKKITGARIMLNAVTRKVHRCLEAEKALIGQPAGTKTFAAAAALTPLGIDYTADFRASKEYRQEVLPVFVRRALEAAATMARA